jgi:phage FluMu gp28-like protein
MTTLLLLMAAILPALHVESSDAKISKYFLGHQVCWIRDESRMRFAEKSVRIGWTYADAFKNARKRLLHAKRDYLFATKDQPSAVEYLKTCEDFSGIFNFARSIISRGEDSVKVEAKNAAGASFTEEVKFGYIKFDNGSRIIAFSSNPYAMAVFGGDVGLDEFAKHPAAEKLWETAQGRITWGYDLGIWSAHDGTDTLFYQFAQEARAGKGGWSYYRVTMEDAVELDLVEKINETRGTNFSREEFLKDCHNRARLEEVYQQAYMCNPTGSTSAVVPWAAIENCRKDYAITRAHLEAAQVTELFGSFRPENQLSREERIRAWLCGVFAPLFAAPAKYRLGFDVAASGEGDLACIYIDRRETAALRLAGLFTCRTDDWNFLKTVLWTFHRRLAALKAAGDETGLGRQICWETAQQFPGIFTPVNFASEKHDMGFALMNQLSVAEKQFPKEEADIAQDYFSLRKIYSGKRWVFTEGRNTLNAASHCDIAWSGALASKADQSVETPGDPVNFAPQGQRMKARHERSCAGV